MCRATTSASVPIDSLHVDRAHIGVFVAVCCSVLQHDVAECVWVELMLDVFG